MRAASGCRRAPPWSARATTSLTGSDSDVAAASAAPAVTGSVVVDPFAGSANTLYWLARHAQARRTVGFELDERVFGATRRNLAILGCDAELSHVGYEAGLEDTRVARDDRLIVFVAPPWADPLDEQGLDLRRTQPPVPAIIDHVARTFSRRKVLLAVQVHESTLAASMIDVRSRCPWSALSIYDVNARVQNHGDPARQSRVESLAIACPVRH
jgi:hypothetical protein